MKESDNKMKTKIFGIALSILSLILLFLMIVFSFNIPLEVNLNFYLQDLLTGSFYLGIIIFIGNESFVPLENKNSTEKTNKNDIINKHMLFAIYICFLTQSTKDIRMGGFFIVILILHILYLLIYQFKQVKNRILYIIALVILAFKIYYIYLFLSCN